MSLTILERLPKSRADARGGTHLAVLRRFRPYHHGEPGGRGLTILTNRINSALFSAAFTGWVRETRPGRRHDGVRGRRHDCP